MPSAIPARISPGCLTKFIRPSSRGVAKVVHDTPDFLTKLRAMRDGQPLRADKYTRLLVDGQLWMTDAEFEVYTNGTFLQEAHGDVLIAGLGLGLVLGPLLHNENVRSVTVLEISPDVIKLIAPKYASDKLTVIQADVHTYEPPSKAFDYVYFDIWPNVPNIDDAQEIRDLKKRYRKSLRKGGRTRAWCQEHARI